jgi:hypothetical protein
VGGTKRRSAVRQPLEPGRGTIQLGGVSADKWGNAIIGRRKSVGQRTGYGVALAVCFLFCAASRAAAQQTPPAPPSPSCLQARDLMTPAEVAEHREKMRSLQSDAERADFRRANHEEMKRRAAARGATLCDEAGVAPGSAVPSPAQQPPPAN